MVHCCRSPPRSESQCVCVCLCVLRLSFFDFAICPSLFGECGGERVTSATERIKSESGHDECERIENLVHLAEMAHPRTRQRTEWWGDWRHEQEGRVRIFLYSIVRPAIDRLLAFALRGVPFVRHSDTNNNDNDDIQRWVERDLFVCVKIFSASSDAHRLVERRVFDRSGRQTMAYRRMERRRRAPTNDHVWNGARR